ncbi:MAG: hypothetical protein HY665_05970 [Chloroflexi bacterium]|nr:hypothetical protein [Chloroflexota bacterium]
MHKQRGDTVSFHIGPQPAQTRPNLIYLTSLFTYSWKPIHEAAAFYRALYPCATIVLGGIYATLMPEHAKLADVDEVHKGLVMEAEQFRPDFTLAPDWQSSIMFGTRGCIRKCAFCAVPRLEGKTWGPAHGIRDLRFPGHRKVVLWDNNILGVPNWRDVIAELREMDVEVDFNQGLDARLITEDVARELAGLRIRPIRMAYDIPSERKALEQAIPALEAAGFNRRRMIVYTLYNFTDTPTDFWHRVTDLLSWGAVSYPMRYEPLNSLVKNKYVSPHWTAQQLEMVARARRVMGYGGAFPPYQALYDKFRRATSFEEAFSMRDGPRPGHDPVAIAGTIEAPIPGLEAQRSQFRELLNDPATLQRPVTCESCGKRVATGERAFAVQDYGGKYVGYICPTCHPNRKWVGGLWRSALGEAFARNGHSAEPLPIGLISRTVH